jgi:hypothetical protein
MVNFWPISWNFLALNTQLTLSNSSRLLVTLRLTRFLSEKEKQKSEVVHDTINQLITVDYKTLGTSLGPTQRNLYVNNRSTELHHMPAHSFIRLILFFTDWPPLQAGVVPP